MTSAPLRDDDARARLSRVRPIWTGMRRVADVVPGCGRTVFHAGPPFASIEEIPTPVRNSICMAAVYEGWAHDAASAATLLRDGLIRSAAAQDHDLLVPLAGVLSPSMAVLEVRDAGHPGSKPVHVAINEGQLHATRLGRLDDQLPSHLRWLNGPFADWLTQCAAHGSIELAPVIAQSLLEGDDGHARTVAGSRLIADILLGHAPPGPHTDAARDFMAASAAFALSPWMAAAAIWLRSAEGLAGCNWVCRAAGNGAHFGIQLASRPGQWITMAAPVPAGQKDDANRARQAVGALGDSAVVDFVGLGAQALAHAATLRAALADALPVDMLDRPRHVLAAAGVVDGLEGSVVDARRCVDSGRGPVVLIGMIDAAGAAGRIGAGVVDVPVELFQTALAQHSGHA